MKHIKFNDDCTIRIDNETNAVQICLWKDNNITEVLSNNGNFTLPDEVEEFDEITDKLEITKVTVDDLVAYAYNNELIFPKCTKAKKNLLIAKWICDRFSLKLGTYMDIFDITLPDATFVFSNEDETKLISAKGNYFKYFDYLYHKLDFKQ